MPSDYTLVGKTKKKKKKKKDRDMGGTNNYFTIKVSGTNKVFFSLSLSLSVSFRHIRVQTPARRPRGDFNPFKVEYQNTCSTFFSLSPHLQLSLITIILFVSDVVSLLFFFLLLYEKRFEIETHHQQTRRFIHSSATGLFPSYIKTKCRSIVENRTNFFFVNPKNRCSHKEP